MTMQPLFFLIRWLVLPKRLLGAAAAATLALSGPGAYAQSDLPGADTARDAALLLGTWEVTVTQYNCRTGVARPPFQSLLAFLPGGVEIETTSNPALQPAQRTPAFGRWTATGDRTFALRTEAFILFSSMAGVAIPRGKQFIAQAIRLTGASSFASTASIAYTTPSEQIVLTGCARAVATRL